MAPKGRPTLRKPHCFKSRPLCPVIAYPLPGRTSPRLAEPIGMTGKTPTRLAIALISVALAGARCSNLAGVFEKPDLQFRGLRVNSIGFDGASLDILVDVYNPNSYRLGIQRFSYDLAIENVHWGLGVTDAPLAVDGRNSASFPLPLDVTWSRLGNAAREVLRTGSVNYGVSGELTVATSIGNVQVPYSKSGRFSVFSGDER